MYLKNIKWVYIKKHQNEYCFQSKANNLDTRKPLCILDNVTKYGLDFNFYQWMVKTNELKNRLVLL